MNNPLVVTGSVLSVRFGGECNLTQTCSGWLVYFVTVLRSVTFGYVHLGQLSSAQWVYSIDDRVGSRSLLLLLLLLIPVGEGSSAPGIRSLILILPRSIDF